MGISEKVPGWLERVLLPQMSEVRGELRAVDAEIGGLERKMEPEFKAVHSGSNRLGERIDGFDRRLGSRIEQLDQNLGAKTGEVGDKPSLKIDGVDEGLGPRQDDLHPQNQRPRFSRSVLPFVSLVNPCNRLKLGPAQLHRRVAE